jgi:hypothetical protein
VLPNRTRLIGEKFYEAVILPRYAGVIAFGAITWVGRGKIDLDAWAHYFQSGGKEYALLYEDFPGNTALDDGLSHEVIKLGESRSVELKFSDGDKQIPNILGWYTLLREISR